MKNLLFIPLIALFLMVSCDNTGPGDDDARYIGRTGCKNLITIEEFDSNQECIEYTYSGNTLKIKHVNAGMNCCPEPMNASISVDGGIITIDESKAANGCKCLCIFDIDYQIDNLPAGSYKLVIKPFLELGSHQPLEGTIDLKKEPSGYFCAERTNYPWSIR